MDIGGGSTELILGEGAEAKALESLHLGCVSMTERFFDDGKISESAFEKARDAARLELRPVKAFFRGTERCEGYRHVRDDSYPPNGSRRNWALQIHIP